MGYPFWVSTNNLGTFNAGTSLTLSPINLVFGETDNIPCVVQLLNGELPPGIQFHASGFQVVLTGELQGVGTTRTHVFTFRISNSVYVSDRTFQITVLQEVSVFEWITTNDVPLLYVYNNQTQHAQIQTTSVPIQAVTYTCTNLNVLTEGIQLDVHSGEFTINLGWLPQTTYTQSKDYVYSMDRLYVCAISGTSSSTQGPQTSGTGVVDTIYTSWQPNIVYYVGAVVHNDLGKLYQCVSTGTSSLMGPTGTGSYIVDGSTIWAYQAQALVWDQVLPDTQVTLNLMCEAQAVTQILRTFDLVLVSREASPIWLTPSGELLQVTPSQLFSYQLQVQDPDQVVLTWYSPNLPDWITLSVTGELFGQAPQVGETTVFGFDVQVSDQIHTVMRMFQIRVVQQAAQLTWSTPPQLPVTSDGVLSNLFVQAESPSMGAFITYGWVGGMLPLGLSLNAQTGHLQGFVEFHAQDKLYQFEIQAQDGVLHIQQQFQVQVISQNRNIHWNLHTPIWGQVKSDLININNTSVVPDSSVYLLNEPRWGRVSAPTIPIISGIKSCAADQLRLLISNYMHAWHVQMDRLQLTQLPGLPYKTLDVQLQDAVAPALWMPNTSYALNQRVSVPNGAQYQARNAGTSASVSPVWDQPQVSDGVISWQQLSSPNTSSAISSPLPWYALHAYTVGQTMCREGITYVCAQSGTSGGTWPHTQAAQVLDNTIIWNRVSLVPPASNLYWPSCVTLMRRVLQQQLGWSTSLGSGAQAVLQTQPSTGGITGVTVTNPGTAYSHAPPVRIQSATGSDAQLQAHVGILSVQVLMSDTGVTNLTQFEIDLGHGVPAQLQVTSVTPFNQAAQISVLHTGAYTQIPSVPFEVMVGTSRITLALTSGLVSVQVTQPGRGYLPSDTVTFTGTEWDPVRYQFVDQFDLNLCVTYVQSDAPVSLENVVNPYEGQQLRVDKVQADLQGVQWQGNTRWDSDSCTWDAHSTQFVEQTTATETTWDHTQLVWDNQITTFDLKPLTQYPQLTLTVFDDSHTLFDYYATVFDATPTSYESRTLTSWVWFMDTHQ